MQKMFRDSNSSVVLERMLLLISQLARMARVSNRGAAPTSPMAANYELIHQSDFYAPVCKLLSHKDAQVRMRVCNLVGAPQCLRNVCCGPLFQVCFACPQRWLSVTECALRPTHSTAHRDQHNCSSDTTACHHAALMLIPSASLTPARRSGNLCRHSAFFYHHLDDTGFVSAIIRCCGDADASTRKFACFALGNAAFHSDSLYDRLASGIQPIVALLADGNPKTRLNAVGALGNMVRSGEQLVPRLMETDAVRVRLLAIRLTAHCAVIDCRFVAGRCKPHHEACSDQYGYQAVPRGWHTRLRLPLSLLAGLHCVHAAGLND